MSKIGKEMLEALEEAKAKELTILQVSHEDKHWATKAHKAHKTGLIGTEASVKLIKDLLSAKS